MLVLGRRIGERLVLDDGDFVITVVDVRERSNAVRLGIDMANHRVVLREEIPPKFGETIDRPMPPETYSVISGNGRIMLRTSDRQAAEQMAIRLNAAHISARQPQRYSVVSDRLPFFKAA